MSVPIHRKVMFYLAAAVIIAVPIVVFFFGAFGLLAWECSAKATAMKLQHTFGPLQGCIVNYRGEFVPIEAVGVRTITVEQP